MAIPLMNEDVEIISKLGDVPGSQDGLSSQGLKERFDLAGVRIKNFINNILIPAIENSVDEDGLLSAVAKEISKAQEDATTAKKAVDSLEKKFPVAIEDGGTGAQTVAKARTNLGAASLGANTFTGHQTLENTRYVRGMLSDGTTMLLLGISSGDNVVIGDNGYPERNINFYGKVNLNNALAIPSGGTGATTVAGILTNLGFTYTTGTVQLDSTNAASGTITYFKYGRIVIVTIDNTVGTSAPSASNTWYQIATGLPKAVTSFYSMPLMLRDSTVGFADDVLASVNASGVLRVKTRSKGLNARQMFGTFVYISES